jgi:GTP-binding protein
MFVDKVSVHVAGGDGGNGVVSWRHEKFIDRGGPDGGDGGDGGDVILVGSNNQNTLATYRYQKELVAEAGKNGFKQKKHGKSGKDLRVLVPVGTVAYNDHGEVVADIKSDGEEVVIAHGGKGGFGNAHFVSSRRQAPKVAEKGEPGIAYDAILELKMIAEVGLIGMPNAGKSTLLSRISNAKPEIANYPFTTIRPNLGVADIDGKRSVLVADIPGLIEGASEGKGLGDEFLRHVERTKVLVHVIDAYNEEVSRTYKAIRGELKAYRVDLSTRPEIIALNKIDGLDEEIVADLMNQLKKTAPKGTPMFAISASSGQGVKELLYKVADTCAQVKEVEEEVSDEVPVIRLENVEDAWQVTRLGKQFIVSGPKINRFARRTDFENEAGIERLRDIMRKMGIMHELERQEINPDDVIIIGDKQEYGRFEY